MGQLRKTLGSDESSNSALNGLKAKFASMKSTDVPEAEAFRIINTKIIVGCGCGGSYTEGHFVIPNDGNADKIIKLIDSETSSNGKIDSDDVESIIRKYPGVSVNAGHYNGSNSSYDPSRYSNLY